MSLLPAFGTWRDQRGLAGFQEGRPEYPSTHDYEGHVLAIGRDRRAASRFHQRGTQCLSSQDHPAALYALEALPLRFKLDEPTPPLLRLLSSFG